MLLGRIGGGIILVGGAALVYMLANSPDNIAPAIIVPTVLLWHWRRGRERRWTQTPRRPTHANRVGPPGRRGAGRRGHPGDPELRGESVRPAHRPRPWSDRSGPAGMARNRPISVAVNRACAGRRGRRLARPAARDCWECRRWRWGDASGHPPRRICGHRPWSDRSCCPCPWHPSNPTARLGLRAKGLGPRRRSGHEHRTRDVPAADP